MATPQPPAALLFRSGKTLRPARIVPKLLLCLAYLTLHILSEHIAQNLSIGPNVHIRQAPGLALSLLVLCGPEFWPVVLAAHLYSSLLINPGQAVWWIPVVLPVLHTFGYAAVAWIVRRRLGPVPLPRNFQDAWVLVWASACATLPWVVFGTWLLVSENPVPTWDAFVSGVTLRWLEGTASILTLVPAAVVFVAPLVGGGRTLAKSHALGLRDGLEVMGQAAAVALAAWVMHSWKPFSGLHVYSVAFVPLVWIAVRHGLPGAVLAILLFNLGAFFGLFPVAGPATHEVIVDFVVFSVIFAAVGLGLGAAVSLRSEAEALAAESRERLALVVAGARAGTWDVDLTDDTVVYDDAWAQMLGYQLEEVPPERGWWGQLIHPEDRPRDTARWTEHLEGRAPLYESDYRLRAKDGSWRWIHARGSVVARGEDGRPLRVAGTHLDISERREAEAEKERLLQIIEASPDFIGSADLDHRITYLNPAFRSILGLSDLAAARALSIADTHPVWASRLIQHEALPAVLSRGIWNGETAVRDARGKEIPVSQTILLQRDNDGNPLFFSTIARDVSKQREAEAARLATERKMLQAQKLESLGILAGGVAHDFNNLLTVIMGNASLAEMQIVPGSGPAAHLAQIRAASVRAAELCKQMLAYAGRGQVSTSHTDLSALVEEVASLLQVSISKKCVLKLDLARELPRVRMDPTQIRQIVMNLVINASDAIGERSGLIRVGTGIMRAEPAYIATTYLSPEITPGDYVFLEVSDNGCGMSPEIQARIFEPFYTTKFTGRGLGLAAVLGIVRQHGGALKVYSEPNRGSTFKLLLPIVEGEPEEPPGVAPMSVPARSGRGTVLVVDDEETVRTVAARILEGVGFTTVLAMDGRVAVDIFTENPRRFCAVLLDLTMPHLNGEETFRELRRLNSEVPIVLMSGFSEQDSVDRFAGRGLAGFIAKPFDHASLAGKMLQVVLPNAASTGFA